MEELNGLKLWNVCEMDGEVYCELFDEDEPYDGSWYVTLEYAISRWGTKFIYGYKTAEETETGIMYKF